MELRQLNAIWEPITGSIRPGAVVVTRLCLFVLFVYAVTHA